MTPTQQRAVALITHQGSVPSAISCVEKNLNGPGDLAVLGHLQTMLITYPADLLQVPGGAKLRDPETGERYIMTNLGVLVQVHSGNIMASRNLPYPLEIYRYGRR